MLGVTAGQVLKCVAIPDRHDGYFTVGNEYTVATVDRGFTELPLEMWCDRGFTLWCEASAFGSETVMMQDDANLVTLDKRDLFDFVRTAIKYAMLEQGSREDDAELFDDATDRTEKCLSDLYGSQS